MASTALHSLTTAIRCLDGCLQQVATVARGCRAPTPQPQPSKLCHSISTVLPRLGATSSTTLEQCMNLHACLSHEVVLLPTSHNACSTLTGCPMHNTHQLPLRKGACSGRPAQHLTTAPTHHVATSPRVSEAPPKPLFMWANACTSCTLYTCSSC